MRNYEVVITTLGENLEGCLAGLLSHVPFDLRVVTVKIEFSRRVAYLFETLKQLGCNISFDFVKPGIGIDRHTAMANLRHDYGVFLDDDIVVLPSGAFDRLVEAAGRYPYSTAIIRFAQNFVDKNVIKAHTEIWEPVSEDDPRVRSSVASFGEGWLRNFDIGREVETNFMPGSCYCMSRDNAHISASNTLKNWGNVGFEDAYIGAKLGKGVCVPNTYAYHYGHFSASSWGVFSLMLNTVVGHPDIYTKE